MINIFYQKNGQITPFMLTIIVILIMAVMVTINIGKVSLTKTHTANATDAGALGSASAMANVFNMLADANEQLQTQYWIFFATASAMFVAATAQLVSIHISACTDPCKAANRMGSFMGIINAIALEILAFYLAQWNFYEQMRDSALEGHNSAVKLGFQLGFSNSGISQKLIPGLPPPSPQPLQGNANNYQATFSDFVDDGIDGLIQGNPQFSSLSYAWIDGQSRTHQVDLDVTLDPPEKYEVRVTNLSYPAEHARFIAIRTLSLLVKGNLLTACGCKKCCNRKHPACCVCWFAACTIASNIIFTIYPLLAAALAGVSPDGRTWKDEVQPLYFTEDILCWIEEVGSSSNSAHNGLVRLDTEQAHQGANLGLWQTQYPNIISFSEANFRKDRFGNSNQGQINPPNPNHEATLVRTD